MAEKEIENIQRELEDVKALLIIFLQNLKVDNQKIADAIGMSPGRISQLINKNKYPRK
ncbi:MAG: hypothetical protein Q7R52_01570 [archaeon]|nr:hypothetical protein [archaeon]